MPWFLRVCSTYLLKTPGDKEKLLIKSNFSFSHSVFYPFGELSAIFIKFRTVVCILFQFGRVKNLSVGKELNTGLLEKSKVALGWLENILGKRENAGYQHFLLFPKMFS